MAEKKRGIDRYLFFLMIIAIVIISFLIVKPFISAILTGLLLGYVFYPFFKLVNKGIKNRNICALVVCIFIIIITLLPTVFVANALIKESFNLYNEAKSNNIDLVLPGFFNNELVSERVKDMLSRGSLLILDGVSDFIFSLPRKLLDMFIIIFLMFYAFRDGPSILKKCKDLLPFDRKTANMLAKEFADITYAVVYGMVITAIAQGIAGGIGFYLFKIPNPILWGTIMALIAIIPFLGPYLVWLPIGIFQLMYGNKFSGIGILLYGIVIISTVDNIMRPKIIGDKAKIHPAIILIGVVGGLKILGFIGIVIGPLMLALLMSFIERYRVSRVGTKG